MVVKMEKDEKETLETQDIEWEEEGFSLKPWMIPAFAGMLILAILICIPLWKLTHRNQNAAIVENGVENSVEATVETVDDLLAEESTETVETGTSAEIGGGANAEAGQAIAGEDANAGVGQVIAGEDANVEAGQAITGEDANTGLDQAAVGNTGAGQAVTDEDANTGVGQDTAGEDDQVVQDPISGNASMSFQEVSENVTAKDVTNLRSVPSTEDSENVVGQLKNGEVLERTGVNTSTGWSRLVYNGETVYAVTQFVTTDLSYKTPVTAGNPNRVSTMDGRVIIFSDCDDYVTPKEYVNLRTEPSTSEGDSTIRIQVHNGENVHRTGYSPDSGWSRVEYNGEVLYVVSSLVQGVTVE